MDQTGNAQACCDPNVTSSSAGQLEGLQGEPCCRICLLEGSTDEDPLISPCKCKGTIEMVHLGCLRHWIRGRLNLSNNASGSYFYTPITCELCKMAYPDYVRLRGERTPLTEVPHTQAPFVVLENMVRDQTQDHQHRGLHVISLAESKLLKLGRGHESDVRIADVSISLWHATIRVHGGQFVLEDRDSKFGTLVALKKPRAMDHRGPVSIQMGRTFLAMSLHAGPALEQPPTEQDPRTATTPASGGGDSTVPAHNPEILHI